MKRDNQKAPAPPTLKPAAGAGKPGLVQQAVAKIAASWISYVDQLVGKNYGDYPKSLDDLLDRSLVQMQVLTGTGNQTLAIDRVPSAIHPSIVGVDPSKLPAGGYQVTASVMDAEGGGKELVIAASPGVTYSVLLLTQKGKQ